MIVYGSLFLSVKEAVLYTVALKIEHASCTCTWKSKFGKVVSTMDERVVNCPSKKQKACKIGVKFHSSWNFDLFLNGCFEVCNNNL